MTNATSKAVIQAMKATFARHGIPDVAISDNEPQYISQDFATLSAE